MSNNKGVNITKYMLGNTPVPNSNTNTKFSTNFFKTTANLKAADIIGAVGAVGTAAGAGKSSSVSRIVAYLLAIIVVILVILLFINFFITPIFKLRPGAPGIIPIPGFDDGKLFWNKTSPAQILNKDLPIASQSYNYSVNLDVFIENPLQFSKYPRIFFSRGAVRKEKPTGETLLGILDNYNLVAALLPDTNDVIVSVLNKDNNMENIIISNASTQEPFRLTMVVMEQVLEVYVNGHLVKTRHFDAVPKDVKGDIYPSSGIEANVTKVRNLKIWARILNTAEIREATPPLSKAKDFGANAMPSSSSCATQAVEDRISKLSVETQPDTSSNLS
jgi:hypothetical protein